MTTADAVPSGGTISVAYWNVNVPPHLQTAACPPSLSNLSEKDRGILATPDADYHVQTWDEVRQVVRDNRLELFQRVPSELRRYRGYVYHLVQRYGSVARFILQERLGWDAPVKPSRVNGGVKDDGSGDGPFACEDDWKILYNDWPYGIDPRIVHLVVWTKFGFDEDPATGDLTPEAREEIDAFVAKMFYSRVPREQVSKSYPPCLDVYGHELNHGS
jgi:hypothetical protein